MSPGNNEPSPTGLFDGGALLTASVSAFVALLYTAGWSYGYHYFSRFHLGLLGLDIKREYFFLYGFWVLKDNLFAVFAILLVSGGLLFLYHFLTQVTGRRVDNTTEQLYGGMLRQNLFLLWRQPFIWIGLPIYFLFLFMIFYHLGTTTGDAHFDRQVEKNFSSYPRVKVRISQKTGGQTGKQDQEFAKGCYRLLLHNKEFLYLFYDDGMSEKIPTEIIPTSSVEVVRVLPLYQSFQECR